MMTDYEALARYARDVENTLRRDLPRHSVLIVVEIEPEGVAVRACSRFGDKDHVVNTVVKWSSCTDIALREAVDSTGRALRQAVRKE